MSWLLRLYPRAWRRRYGDEMAALLAGERRSPRLVLDLVAGAIDARLNPQLTPGSVPEEGDTSMRSLLVSCHRSSFTHAEMRASALWMIGAAAGLPTLAMVLRTLLDDRTLSDALLYGSFPMALILASQASLLRPYSRAARIVIVVAALSVTYLFFVGITLLSEII